MAHYLDLAERRAPGDYAGRTTQLAFLLKQKLQPAAQKLSQNWTAKADQPALASNLALLRLFAAPARKSAAGPAGVDAAAFATVTTLNAATFAALYHAALAAARAGSPTWLPKLAQLNARPANQAYDEQLVFLQALTRHALGQELRARQLLAPLAAGTGASARYYQNLLGLWQLQQGQFATAADQLDQAGVTDSTVRVAVRALAQQPMAHPLSPPPLGTAWLAQARQAEQRRDTAQARRLYRRLVAEAPFNEPGVLATAAFHGRHHDALAAYDALHAGLNENPRSQPLLKAYVLAAADAGLSEYAATALAQLRQQLPPAEYTALMAAHAARQAARAAAAASFSTGSPVALLP